MPGAPDTIYDLAALASRFRLVLTPLVRQLRTQVEGDMTPSLMSALGTVAREGPISLGDLAAAERVSPPMATKLANALVERRLVERKTCAEDRRIVHLVLSAEGRGMLDRSHQRRNAWLADRFATLDTDELDAVARSIEVIERLTHTRENPR